MCTDSHCEVKRYLTHWCDLNPKYRNKS